METHRFAILDREKRQIAEVTIHEENGHFFVERSAFINSFRIEIDNAQVVQLVDAASREDWRSLDAFDPELLPWYCRECQCNYPADAWTVWAKFDDAPDEHWLDSYRGRCPNGHERVVAD